MEWATFNELVGKTAVIVSVGTTCVYLVRHAIKDGNDPDSKPNRPVEKKKCSENYPVTPR